MAKERIFELPETKGTFQVRGTITGQKKDNFYKESTTKTGKNMRRTSFGVTYEPKKTMYVNMQGMPVENVYFSKSVKQGEKPDVKKIPWSDRFKFKEEGYRMIGNNIGVTKAANEKGELVNVKKVLTDFDSIKEITDHLKDDDSVFIKGKLEYSSYENDNGEKRNSLKLVPTQVSLCKAPIDFTKEDYEKVHDFTQVIIVNSIADEKVNEKPTGRTIVIANIVNYASIEEAEFIIENSGLAKQIKKNLAPFNAIKVWGKISMVEQVEEVDSDNVWGEENKMEKQNSGAIREFVITGADPSSIDKNTYTEANIAEAKLKIKKAQDAKNDFGSSNADADTTNGAWGSMPTGEDDDMEDEFPWGN